MPRVPRFVATALTASLLVPAALVLGAAPATAAHPGTDGAIAFASFVGGTPGSQIFTVDPVTGARIDLSGAVYGDDMPDYSPRGDKIVFRHGAIWVMNADGSGRHQVGSNQGSEDHPTWSPDGATIAFDDNGDVWTMRADGANRTQLTTDHASSDPQWSPDGSKIAFVSNRGGDNDIYSMNIDGSGQVDLSNDPDNQQNHPEWSPDGTKLAFVSTDLVGHGTGTVGPDLWTMDANGANAAPLHHHQYQQDLLSDGSDPAWSPDGSAIAFAANNGTGGTKVWKVALGSDQDSQVTAESGNPGDQELSWRPIRPVLTATERFVYAAFQDFLHRAPTTQELAADSVALDAHTQTRAGLARQLSGTVEWVSAIVQRLYRDTLGRDGDPGGLAYWTNEIRSGHRSVAAVAANIYASPEYYEGIGGGTPTSWVTDLYRKLLLREPDASGRNYWVGQVAATNRVSVALRFFQSAESAATRTNNLYLVLLGRPADAAGLAYWSGRVVTDGDISLAINLSSSDEYLARAQGRF